MAVSVRIEDEAFADIRFKVLGNLLGSNEYMALGIMAHLWRACTQLNSYKLPKPLVAQIVDPELLVSAHLAEVIGDDVRIRGTKGRIEWLATKRKNGRKGGQHGHLGGRPKKPLVGFSQKPHEGIPEKPPPAPAPAPAPAQEKKEEKEKPAAEIDRFEELANWYAFHYTGEERDGRNFVQMARKFRAIVDAGTSFEALEAEVKRAGRNSGEPFWEIRKRLGGDDRREELPAQPPRKQRALSTEDMIHGDYNGVTGFTKDTKACRNPECMRKQCVAAREKQ